MLVIDASALVGWVMPDETDLDLEALSADHAEIAAPWLIWAELRNILIVSGRRGRLPEGMAEQILLAVDGFGLDLDVAPASAVVMDLARRHRLTAYDALYLELALRRGGALASLDAALRRAAQAEGVSVAGG